MQKNHYQKLSFLLLLICFVGLSSCQSYKPNKTSEEQITYLALGDSYTIGESVGKAQRYPNVLAKELRADGLKVLRPQIIATSGWTCQDLSNAITEAEQEDNLLEQYDVVSLLIGVNDQYRGYDIEKYPAQFDSLLRRAIALAPDASRVFVVSIPDWGVTNYAKSKKKDEKKVGLEIDAYNAINKRIAKKYDVKYFDITPISREGKTNKSLIALDGLHPSHRMYERWVELMIDEGVAQLFDKNQH